MIRNLSKCGKVDVSDLGVLQSLENLSDIAFEETRRPASTTSSEKKGAVGTPEEGPPGDLRARISYRAAGRLASTKAYESILE